MGPAEDPSSRLGNQGKGSCPQCEPRSRRPRRRICLLKGCGRVFRPDHPLTRYCSDHCREEARKWREWKARHQYRQTARGKQIRRAQSRRYRQRRKHKIQEKTSGTGGARVITRKFFFVHLRSPRMLRRIRAQPEIAAAAILFPCVPAGPGTSSRAGAAVEGTSPRSVLNPGRYSPDILFRAAHFR
jgi:hypothetical protein